MRGCRKLTIDYAISAVKVAQRRSSSAECPESQWRRPNSRSRWSPCSRTIYAYLLHDRASGATAIVDPSEAEPMLKAAAARGWTITHVLDTHHHNDHCGGNLGIKKATGAKVVGPAYDRERIPGIDVAVDEQIRLRLRRASCGRAVHSRPYPGTYRVPLRRIPRPCSAATPCSRSVAAGCSRARPM